MPIYKKKDIFVKNFIENHDKIVKSGHEDGEAALNEADLQWAAQAKWAI